MRRCEGTKVRRYEGTKVRRYEEEYGLSVGVIKSLVFYGIWVLVIFALVGYLVMATQSFKNYRQKKNNADS